MYSPYEAENPPAHDTAEARNHALAITALVFSIVSAGVGPGTVGMILELVLAPVGAILGHIAARSIRRSRQRYIGAEIALAAAILGWLVFAYAGTQFIAFL